MANRMSRSALVVASLAIVVVPVASSLGDCWVPGVSRFACFSYWKTCTLGGTTWHCPQSTSSSGCTVTTVVNAPEGGIGHISTQSSEGCTCIYTLTNCHASKVNLCVGAGTETIIAVNEVPSGDTCVGEHVGP